MQERAATELETGTLTGGGACPRDTVIGDCSGVRRLITDYKHNRDQIRSLTE